jgi:hypothetical protein
MTNQRRPHGLIKDRHVEELIYDTWYNKTALYGPINAEHVGQHQHRPHGSIKKLTHGRTKTSHVVQ